MRLGHIVSIWKNNSKNTGSGAVHLNLAKSYRKNKGAVLELERPLCLMLIIMLLLSGS